jgi:hypothetical protein
VNAPQLAQIFIDTVFRRFGMPTSLVSHFHVSQLKPYVSSTNPIAEPTNSGPLYTCRQGDYYEVETILGKRRVRNSWHYLVKWTGYDDFDNTWEPLANVRHLSD